MNPFVKEIGGAFARWFVSIVCGYLVANHYLAADQSDQFSNAMLEHILIYGPGVAALAWSILAKYKGRLKFLAALELPAYASEEQAKVRAKVQGRDLMRTAGAILLVLFIAAPAKAQTPLELVNQMQADLDKLRAAVTPAELPEPPKPVVYTTEAEFDAAYKTAAPGDTILLAPSFVYSRHFVVDKSVTIAMDGLADGGMDVATTELPKFMAGVDVPGEDVTLRGVEVRHTNHLTDLVTNTGARALFDRVRLKGDPVAGAKRGLALNGPGSAIIDSVVDDAFQSYPGNDSQAVIVWNNPGPWRIERNKLYAGSETILIGGADSASEAEMPHDGIIRGNYIGAKPEWQPLPIGMKSRLELKVGRNILIEDNDIDLAWGGHGQDGYCVSFTVRNQDGRAPWSTIQDITFRNNRLWRCGAAFNLLGVDNIIEKATGAGRVAVGQVRPSVRMRNVTIAHNTVDLDPVAMKASVKMILISNGPADTTIDDNSFTGTGMTSVVYFVNGKSDNLTITNNRWPVTRYKVFGSGVSSAAATWSTFVASGLLQGNVEQ